MANFSYLSSFSKKSLKQHEKDQYKCFIGVCKFKYIDYKNKHVDSLEQVKIKKEAVYRFQNIRNNIAPIVNKINQTINLDDDSIDTTLLLAVGDDLSFDIEIRIQCKSNDNTKMISSFVKILV